ncbi:hypothetical protein G9A89_006299 [Geosiphon pyriformis]|nr:hypothetical protein G9A89_006299 [Geosiphon pyriformis]
MPHDQFLEFFRHFGIQAIGNTSFSYLSMIAFGSDMKTVKSNKEGIMHKTTETQTLISFQPAIITDVNNDMERELQALGATMVGRARFLETSISLSHLDDYFAEMGIEDTTLNDDFDIVLEEAATTDKRPNKWQKTGAVNKKRSTKVDKLLKSPKNHPS